jgi:hypothetical protein
MFCLLWSTIYTYSEDDVEEGGIKIKKKNEYENGNFFKGGRRKKGKKFKKIYFLFQITTFGCRRVR